MIKRSSKIDGQRGHSKIIEDLGEKVSPVEREDFGQGKALR